MECQCRRCTLDRFNRLMAAGARCFLPPNRYYCERCGKSYCEAADDHRLACRKYGKP
jgi:hypothetical protein